MTNTYLRRLGFSLLSLALYISPANAAIDTLVTIVDEITATNESPIASFGYNPTDDTMLVSSYGSGGALRKVSNLSTAPTSEVFVTATELQLYYRDGDPDRSVSSPLQSSILFNPQPIVDGETTIPAFSFAVFYDNSRTKLPSSTTVDPAATKRFYTYNLQNVVQPEDGRDVFTTLATLEDMQNALGLTSTSSNQGRRGAWSGDGQFMYFADSSTNYGGIWKLNPVSGAIEQLLDGDGDTNIEPGVLTSGGVDTVYISGDKYINKGGIDSFTYDGTTAGPRTTRVTKEDLQDFLELTGTDVAKVSSISTDTDGNIYFNSTDSTPDRRAIFRLDSQGRISKVVSHAERDLFFTGDLNSSPKPNSNTLRTQTRTVTHPTAGDITQIMYAESSGINVVAGAYAFKAGDFDRDGDLDSGDLALFASSLTTRGVEIVLEDDYKFDMNANRVIDWKDVKILQQFANIPNGDADFDGDLDFTDLDTMSTNYYTVSGTADKKWLHGDIASLDGKYMADAADVDTVNFADLLMFAEEWIDGLSQAIQESDLTSRYSGQFLSDAMDAFGLSTESLLGDYNGNGVVDAADYTVWRDSLGTTGSGLIADGHADGVIDMNDYAIWKLNFGNSLPTSTSVPEPTSALILLGLLSVNLGRRAFSREIS